MPEFSDKDIDKTWSANELNELSEKELTQLSFKKNLKNWGFFFVGTVIVSQLVKLGIFGKVIGWIYISFMGIASLEGLFGFFTTIISILIPIFSSNIKGKDTGWKIIQIFLSGLSGLFYIGMGVAIYLQMKGVFNF